MKTVAAHRLLMLGLQFAVLASLSPRRAEAGTPEGPAAAPSPAAPGGGARVRPITNGAEVLTGAQRVRVQFESPVTVHVTKCMAGEQPAGRSLIVLPHAAARLDIAYAEEPGRVTVRSGRLCVAVSRSSGAVSYCDALGDPLLGEEGAASITPEAVAGEAKAYSIQTNFRLSPGEGIYGLGQHQSGLMNYRGHSVTLVQANTQSSNPFLVSTRGYGILWDNYSKTIFSDNEDGCSVWSDVADNIDYYFVYGGSMDGAIAGYRDLTGAAPLYGRWAYGYWQSKEHYENRDEVLKVAAEYRARAIPIDSIVQDWDYWDGRDNWNQLFFDPKLFPRPAEMIDILHRENFHFMISIWCGFGPATPVYREMEQRGFLYPTVGWAGFRFFDAYNPEATDLYWKYVRDGLFSRGVDAWWMDSTEPDIVNALTKDAEEYEMKRVGSNHLGTFARYLNTYPLMATEAVYRNQRGETDRKRVFILTRSTFAGQQRAAATTWSGDIGASWGVYRNQIAAGLNHSMSGIPYWTFDIGAFVIGSYGGYFWDGGKDPAYQELYTRMFQFGSFSPIFRAHGSETPREIWEFGKFTDVLVDFDRLRYRLMPYIYSNAWRVTSEGYTPMRGLPMDFPGDHATYAIADQYMFGPSLMVCPVTEYMLHRPPGKSVPISSAHFRTRDGRPGLDATYYGDDHFGAVVHTGTEPSVNLDWYTGWPAYVKKETFSMRWEGQLIPTETGVHRFHVKTFGPRLLDLDGKALKFTYTSVEGVTEPVRLEAGRPYRFSFATSNSVLGAFRAQLFWKTPSIFEEDSTHEARPQTRTVYLPAGRAWFDFWTGRTTGGGQSVDAAAPIERIPLLVPSGSIIPMGPPVQYASEKPDAPMELRVYPGSNASFTLYEDENDTYDYEKGVYSTIRIDWDDAARRLTIGARRGSYPGMPVKRSFQVVVVGPGHGAGPGVTDPADRVVAYSGDALAVQF
jgi:alpha-D-xyloside xylohydrolase